VSAMRSSSFDFLDFIDDLRAAIVAVGLLDFLEFAGNDLASAFWSVEEDFF